MKQPGHMINKVGNKKDDKYDISFKTATDKDKFQYLFFIEIHQFIMTSKCYRTVK